MNGRVSVGLRVSVCLRRVMSGAVLCMVFPSVLDSQNTRQRWCQVRRRVTGDDPRTDQNDDEKGVKRAEATPAKLSWLPGWLSFCLVVRLCFWFLVLCLFAPVFLVPASGLASVRKGDVPRTDPFFSLPVRGFFRYSHVFWRYWEICDDLFLLLSASSESRNGSPRAFDPPPRVERALRGGCASFSFLLVVLSPLRWCSRSMSQVVANLAIFQRRRHFCDTAISMQIFVGLKRTWDQKLSAGWMLPGQLISALTGFDPAHVHDHSTLAIIAWSI